MAATGGRVDATTPVVVGVGQVNVEGHDAPEPAVLLADAARRAGADAGSPRLLAAVRSVQVVRIVSWRYRDPGALVAGFLGLGDVHTVTTTNGGQTPQALLNRAAEDIRDGRLDVVLIGGAESFKTLQPYLARGERPGWTVQVDDVAPSETYGPELRMLNPTEEALGLHDPAQLYPLFESALRRRLGEGVAEHRRRIAELWASFAAVAAANPWAAIRRAPSADEIGTPGVANRMVGFPYTKLMNANPSVNQAAAVILCSAGRARELGVAADRWVFPLAGAEANEVPHLSNRADLSASVALRVAGRALFDRARTTPADVAHVDLYSCFPSAVQVAAGELGIPDGVPLTVTGGLTFAGGPWNNYVSHSVATMAGVLRDDPGSLGLCTANGGALGKQALTLYGTEPPPRPFAVDRPQHLVDAGARRALIPDYEGPAVLEAATVMHGRDGSPEKAYAACSVAHGARTWAASSDPDVLGALMADGLEGSAVTIRSGAELVL